MARHDATVSLLVSDFPVDTVTSWLTAFRYHWEMYPHDREVPEHVIQELLGILVHAGVGTLWPAWNVLWPYLWHRLYDFP